VRRGLWGGGLGGGLLWGGMCGGGAARGVADLDDELLALVVGLHADVVDVHGVARW